MTNEEITVAATEYLTQWGVYHRGHERNHNDFPPENYLYRYEKANVYRPYSPDYNTDELIKGKTVGENKQEVGADAKHIDIHKVIAIDNLINRDDMPILTRSIARRIYIDLPEKPRKNPDMIAQAAKKLNIGVQVVRTAHARLINFIENELELKKPHGPAN